FINCPALLVILCHSNVIWISIRLELVDRCHCHWFKLWSLPVRSCPKFNCSGSRRPKRSRCCVKYVAVPAHETHHFPSSRPHDVTRIWQLHHSDVERNITRLFNRHDGYFILWRSHPEFQSISSSTCLCFNSHFLLYSRTAFNLADKKSGKAF